MYLLTDHLINRCSSTIKCNVLLSVIVISGPCYQRGHRPVSLHLILLEAGILQPF